MRSSEIPLNYEEPDEDYPDNEDRPGNIISRHMTTTKPPMPMEPLGTVGLIYAPVLHAVKDTVVGYDDCAVYTLGILYSPSFEALIAVAGFQIPVPLPKETIAFGSKPVIKFTGMFRPTRDDNLKMLGCRNVTLVRGREHYLYEKFSYGARFLCNPLPTMSWQRPFVRQTEESERYQQELDRRKKLAVRNKATVQKPVVRDNRSNKVLFEASVVPPLTRHPQVPRKQRPRLR
jgi:hypothetical protein